MPKADDYFRTLRPIPVVVVYVWDAPFTSGRDVVLPADLLICLNADIPAGAVDAACRPLQYEAWEPVLVEEWVRGTRGYVGFHCVISLAALHNDCTLLP